MMTKSASRHCLRRSRSAIAPGAILAAVLVATAIHEGEASAQVVTPGKAQTADTVRPSDNRPMHDHAKLAGIGIRAYESKRLKLYTNLDPAVAKTLPAVIDAAYDAWVEYFGALPPNREKTELQVTGYLMMDKAHFREAGLLPADLPDFVNGRHRGAEFWMLDQKDAYYRRHLMIHEATHCYMTILGGPLPPVWYMEGMAEHFGTHRSDKSGKIQFRAMPENIADYAGLGRIALIQREVAAGRGRSLDGVFDLVANDYLKNEAYAWSWGLCAFLDGHPRWKKKFREQGQDLTYRGFDRQFREAFDADLDEMRIEWALFATSIQEGFDGERAAVSFRRAMPQAAKVSVDVAADRGWQSSGIVVEAGQEYDITATGRFTLADKPRPWISEPQGVSIRYSDGKPLGMLVGVIVPTATDRSETAPLGQSVRTRISIGRQHRLKPEAAGTLFLRLNDAWGELADNTGRVTVEITAIRP